MASKIDDLEVAILQLPEEARAHLALVLLISLDEPQDEAGEQAWMDEAERRYGELRRGEVQAEDSDEVFREARARRRAEAQPLPAPRSRRFSSS